MSTIARVRCLLTTAALAIAVSSAGCSGKLQPSQLLETASDLKTAVVGIDEKEEITIGREVAGRTLGVAPLVRDAALQSYVNRVGHWVALQSERAELPWTFAVIDTPAINAFAAPGGYILITRGLYQLLDNEAQLAGVLAHEIAHVVQRHHIKLMERGQLVSTSTKIAQQQTRSDILKNMAGTGAEVFARALDKDAEFDADRRGIVLAARAGYNPFGLVDVLQKLQARGSRDSAALKLLFETHPPPGERLTKLGESLTPNVSTLPAGRQPQIRRAR